MSDDQPRSLAELMAPPPPRPAPTKETLRGQAVEQAARLLGERSEGPPFVGDILDLARYIVAGDERVKVAGSGSKVAGMKPSELLDTLAEIGATPEAALAKPQIDAWDRWQTFNSSDADYVNPAGLRRVAAWLRASNF